MVFADRLRALRKKSGLTQDEFSKQTGIGRSAVGMYESGKREPNYTTLSKVARFYHVSTDYLLGRTDTPAEPPTRKTEPSARKPHDVQQQLHSLLADLAPDSSCTFCNGHEPLDDVTRDFLRRSRENILLTAQQLAKAQAISHASPGEDDTATRIGKEILAATPAAQIAISQIISADNNNHANAHKGQNI